MKLEENILTHASDTYKIADILKDGTIMGPVSFSKYPRFEFEDESSHIAFKRPELEAHLEKQVKMSAGGKAIRQLSSNPLNRPVYFRPNLKGRNVILNPKSKRARPISLIGSQKFNAQGKQTQGVRYEQDIYKDEREVSATRSVHFKPEHVSHLGHHASLGDGWEGNGLETSKLDRSAKEIAQLAFIAARHNKPIKISAGLHPNHDGYKDYLKKGEHEDIERYREALRPKLRKIWGHLAIKGSMPKIGPDKLLDSMVVSLGNPDDTPYLSRKSLNPRLKRTAFEAAKMSAAEKLIEEKLYSSF